MDSSIAGTLVDGDTATVAVRGEIDYSNAGELANRLLGAVTEHSAAAVRVELGDATFIDSTGLGALIEGYRAATAAGVRFSVANPTPAFRRVLSVTGLTDLFGLIESADQAGAEPAQATGS